LLNQEFTVNANNRNTWIQTISASTTRFTSNNVRQFLWSSCHLCNQSPYRFSWHPLQRRLEKRSRTGCFNKIKVTVNIDNS